VQNDRHYLSSRVAAIAVTTLFCCSLLYCTPARAEAHVILLRGWFGVFSTGLDVLADSLKAKGIRAEVAGHLAWRTAADEILRERAAGKSDAVVLVGHSQGANNVIDMARLLEAKNVPVALLVTLAPYNQDSIPGNVMWAVNYYQSGGWGAPLTAGPGFRGKLSNIDVKDDATVSHINIDKSTRIQAEIAREIGDVVKAK
jgi:pimeloyl-ACP methyl ester carboxylesterase